MGYRILADETVERATVHYLEKLDHDVARLDDMDGEQLDARAAALDASPDETTDD